MSTIGSRLPASEARSYVDAIRASVVESDAESDAETDDVEPAAFSVADELMSESREPLMADAYASDGSMELGETTSAKSNLDAVSLEASDSMSVSSAMNPHVETDESLSASEAHVAHDDSESMAVGETTSAKSNIDDESMATDESMSAPGHVGRDDSASMTAASSSMNPHVETDESMSASDDVSVSGELMSGSREPHMADASGEDSMVIGESLEANVAHSDSDSMSVSSAMNPHVETDESLSASEAHVAHDDSESMAVGETTSAKSNIDDESMATDESMSASGHVGRDDSASMTAASSSTNPHVETDDFVSAESNIDRDSESDSEPMIADESHDAHVGIVDSESMSAARSQDPHVETDAMSAGTHADDDSDSMASPDGGHDSPSTGDLMAAPASDEPHAGHDASQVGHEMNSAEPDLDAEAHVGHNAPVNRESDNDPESSGN